ncbi:hypothetical protein STK_25245 [Sulfurisphaera tokodaii str. 7]|uniref:Uncharacterized protein n=1 Tax=Sulfurisphaera tokodaii (strain DSM 16993 / JCM 10545 / NBRC 100140 / 7) TaxID=273063 RepID=Q96XI9_SULTO|nr:hypothetical protein STK_25245 [Sulfurisphaera tokodaii str. 7]
MVKINISAASILGGFKTKFWAWLFIGVSITGKLVSLLTFLELGNFCRDYIIKFVYDKK